MNKQKPFFNREGYWTITAILFTGTVTGCEYCIPLLAATLITGALTGLMNKGKALNTPELAH